MEKCNLIVTVRIKWWFKYLYFPLFVVALNIVRKFNPYVEPDISKIEFWLIKAAVVDQVKMVEKS